MRKKQKIYKKKQSQRAYKGFIFLVNWYKNKFDVISHISNIYGNEDKKERRDFLHLSNSLQIKSSAKLSSDGRHVTEQNILR